MRSKAGFTLIELLIVLVLIGVMTGMAMLGMGNADRGDQQRLEAERLAMLLNLAEQEAMLRGSALAVELFGKGYRFLTIEQGEWQAETADQLFKPRSLDAGMQLSLWLDEESVYLNNGLAAEDSPSPHIIVAPDGATGNFEIGIAKAGSDSLYIVANTGDDGVTVSNHAVKP